MDQAIRETRSQIAAVESSLTELFRSQEVVVDQHPRSQEVLDQRSQSYSYPQAAVDRAMQDSRSQIATVEPALGFAVVDTDSPGEITSSRMPREFNTTCAKFLNIANRTILVWNIYKNTANTDRFLLKGGESRTQPVKLGQEFCFAEVREKIGFKDIITKSAMQGEVEV